MKTTSITVERNFHIMNDDRFIMEKISVTVEVCDEDYTQDCIDNARKQIEANFKAAYPKVYTHLNFDEVRQLDKEERNFIEVGKIRQQDIEDRLKDFDNGSYQNHIILPTPSEKIKQIPIEEQIQVCKTIRELNSFKIIARMNPKLTELWDKKSKELNEST